MEILRKNKEGLKISLNGYMYVKNATKSSRIRRPCSMRDSRECKGAVTTKLELCLIIDHINSLLVHVSLSILRRNTTGCISPVDLHIY